MDESLRYSTARKFNVFLDKSTDIWYLEVYAAHDKYQSQVSDPNWPWAWAQDPLLGLTQLEQS